MVCSALTVLFLPEELCVQLNLLYRRGKVLNQFFNSTQGKIVVWLKIPLFPEEMQGVMNEGKIYNLCYSCKMQDLFQVKQPGLHIVSIKWLYVHQENLFVSPHSNGSTHGSFQPCDHNLQFHTWLSATAQVVWIAWVRHIPSTVSLFIVLIFRERFISFRKSSRKHWMPISCWPVQEGGCGNSRGGGMEI